MKHYTLGLSLLLLTLLTSGCGKDESMTSKDASMMGDEMMSEDASMMGDEMMGEDAPMPGDDDASMMGDEMMTETGEKQALFGDTHVHTMYSFDAFLFGTKASPDDAYRFAKGAPLKHPGGFVMQLQRPLDFYAVSDHAFFLGSVRAMTMPNEPLSKHPLAEGMDKLHVGDNRRAKFNAFRDLAGAGEDAIHGLTDKKVSKKAWTDIIETANHHNEPGHFTALIAYEYTASHKDAGNLHRNVIFRGNRAPDLPFSRIDSTNPEDLWDWMDEVRRDGMDSIAIPHNSNGSNGHMFALTTFDGNPLSERYTEQRMRNEPLVELTQIKGTSETHPALSPNDEWANFEIMPYRVATNTHSKPSGSYVREALARGLELNRQRDYNPFEFGFIGSSDTHNASYAGDESNYWGKIGEVDGTPRRRASIPLQKPNADSTLYANVYYDIWSAAGLAGVWATANTREAIFDAMRRRETFATSGPRIQIQLSVKVRGEAEPKLMGSTIETPYSSPQFSLEALKDALSAPLERLQIIKVWATRDGPREAVYDVACSDGRAPDPVSHRCADNGAGVDLTDCSYDQDKGAAMLSGVWQDPSYNRLQHAAYYARVLENPTCRWSTWDALRNKVQPRTDLALTIQERAWSSPIWLKP